jgi:hypothetical protein
MEASLSVLDAAGVLAMLEEHGVRVSLSDDDRIELRGADAPTELRRALMRCGTAVRAILAQRRDAHEALVDTQTLLRRPMHPPYAPKKRPKKSATTCTVHVGFRDKPCERCERAWRAHYPWVKGTLPNVQPVQRECKRGNVPQRGIIRKNKDEGEQATVRVG